MLEEMVYMIPMNDTLAFVFKKKKKNGFFIIICRTMKITGSYFFSLNQECLRDSAMTLDFSESVQSFS